VDEHGAALDRRFRPWRCRTRGTVRFGGSAQLLERLLGMGFRCPYVGFECGSGLKLRAFPSQKRDKSCAFAPFEAVGSSGAPAFGRPCLRSGDKAADAGVAGLSLLPPPPVITSVPAAAGAADESRRQVVGFAEAAASGPAVGLQPQPQQRQTTAPQQARKSRRCWSPELHRQFVAALNQLGGPQGTVRASCPYIPLL
jgi:hypothetical protein